MTWLEQFVGRDVGVQVVLLVVAFVLCSAIGLERQARRKSAGYRTHVLVGLGSCIFTLVSAYGFATFIDASVPHDPTRIAAQVVSGIGFLGAGVIFKGSSTVRGLTTAGSIWISAAVGMACGAGMVVVAAVSTATYLVVLFAVAPLVLRLSQGRGDAELRIAYTDGTGAMRHILEAATKGGFSTRFDRSTRALRPDGTAEVTVDLAFIGNAPTDSLIPELAEIPGVKSVRHRAALSPYAEEDDD